MLEKKALYLCKHCKNIVESLWNGKPAIVCCSDPMVKLVSNTEEAATEKHIPVIERNGTTVTVKVGEVAHPMDPDHYILCIELLAKDKVYRHDFKEGDKVASTDFLVAQGVDLTARAFCNKHGLWSV